ncbi:GHKL domain-containing protein [Bacillus sp. ISL-47]|uniref:histidine kinase N-terminal domain-containing protein n=1 Tax=Bacillus sp. ISL-47 TaxID=2819130 RepID=UPI001BE9A7F2|nr:histidine kinase N-terminal domain-containing protein [Bacillus sp. ISL-47]MBT2690760.1 GHKL domain-containing protein [Bacillus sp. ISL-47]MBT2709704.1 GHKL domain-containing protein [Pseudomonas sp. ISL-84]
MAIETNDVVLELLLNERETLLNEWKKKVLITDDDPYKEKIRDNGDAMFNLVIQFLLRNENDLEIYIQQLAYSVAEQRVKAEINIGDFVHNVNIGRSIVQKYLNHADISFHELQEYHEKISYCFDQFLYHAVSRYTDAKDQIIKEKTQFIDSTHKDRLTLLGQMTSSFIHEFRNPLTSVQGFIQLLKSEHPNMKYLDIISNELEQLNFRISQFLLLSKKELIGKEKITFSLNELIEEVLIFLYPSILDGKVKILQDLKQEIHLKGYADEIRQVLINIIFNAIDVLTQYRSDPVIEIKSKLTGKGQIKLDIANNGPSIPDHLVSSIFEPFVTTKTLGTGLGLFVCREIIEKHQGKLTCDSNPDRTVFSILLPIIEQKAD